MATLTDTAKALVADHKGLLAMDESMPTCNKRFAALGIPQTEEMRRQWRQLIVTAPGLGDSISGAILFDETVHQSTEAGESFVDVLTSAGIIPGIKLDQGAVDLPFHAGEKLTEGLDGLRDRLERYAGLGMRFAKWRAVIAIDDTLPSRACIAVNAHALARYAALCQEAGIVPIVEPEVLMDGGHTLQRCASVTDQVLHELFDQLHRQDVALEGLLLKPNMVLPGLKCATQDADDEVAAATIGTFLRAVPAAVPGIVFLSGGQSAALASSRLNAMNLQYRGRLPWAVTFSYSRAIQQPALDAWHGDAAQVGSAQQALVHRAACNRAARQGRYSASMERAAA
ncbi:fructose-bisphosphate aldolase class I [soil metagenome]